MRWWPTYSLGITRTPDFVIVDLCFVTPGLKSFHLLHTDRGVVGLGQIVTTLPCFWVYPCWPWRGSRFPNNHWLLPSRDCPGRVRRRQNRINGGVVVARLGLGLARSRFFLSQDSPWQANDWLRHVGYTTWELLKSGFSCPAPHLQIIPPYQIQTTAASGRLFEQIFLWQNWYITDCGEGPLEMLYMWKHLKSGNFKQLYTTLHTIKQVFGLMFKLQLKITKMGHHFCFYPIPQ